MLRAPLENATSRGAKTISGRPRSTPNATSSATQYDKLAVGDEAASHIAAINGWLRPAGAGS